MFVYSHNKYISIIYIYIYKMEKYIERERDRERYSYIYIYISIYICCRGGGVAPALCSRGGSRPHRPCWIPRQARNSWQLPSVSLDLRLRLSQRNNPEPGLEQKSIITKILNDKYCQI